MKETEIALGRENYKVLKEKNDKMREVANRIYALEKTKKVSEYIDLLEVIRREPDTTRIVSSNEELAVKAFDKIAFSTLESNEIFVHLGTVTTVDELGTTVNELYIDLETKRKILISPSEVEGFENKYKVIKTDKLCKEDFYLKLRKQFFYELTRTTQEESLKKVLRKNTKRKK